MNLLSGLRHYLLDLRDLQRIAVAVTKGAAMMNAREVDLRDPATWEFSGFSQNGEDGILQVLRSQLVRTNRYFVEIGAGDGIENNTAWLVVAEKYAGLMIDGNPDLTTRARRTVIAYSIGAECLCMFVRKSNAPDVLASALHTDPDVFSLDVDGNDYYIARALFERGFRPKIAIVEYNSVYGPARRLTIEYREDFAFGTAHPTQLYYGASIAAWRRMFGEYGYRFVTVDRNGVNAVFADPAVFSPSFLEGIRGVEFAENRYQLRKFRIPSNRQFELIADQKFVSV